MKTIFKVFGLMEENLLSEVNLFSSGLDKDFQMITFRKHLQDFDNKIDALKFIDDAITKIHFEHGFEIVETFNK